MVIQFDFVHVSLLLLSFFILWYLKYFQYQKHCKYENKTKIYLIIKLATGPICLIVSKSMVIVILKLLISKLQHLIIFQILCNQKPDYLIDIHFLMAYRYSINRILELTGHTEEYGSCTHESEFSWMLIKYNVLQSIGKIEAFEYTH